MKIQTSKLRQNLVGETIHDDAAANCCRYHKKDFITLREVKNAVLEGVGGKVKEPLYMGTVRDGDDILKDVVYTPNLDYNIDSQHQLVDYYGWKEDKTAGEGVTRYIKRDRNGKVITRVYKREKGQSHKVRVHVQKTYLEKVLFKMEIIHECYGHMKAKALKDLLRIYPDYKLGFNLEEVNIWEKYGSCRACAEGLATRRRRDGNNNLIYLDYFAYGDKEGIHIDVFFIDEDVVFLLARSHRYKHRWMKLLYVGFEAEDVKECLLEILGDYKYANKEIQFIRSDKATTFVKLKPWAEKEGIRWYIAPPGMHTSKIERDGRTIKDLMRVIIQQLEYRMPRSWLPYVLEEAVYLLTIRYDEELGGIPREIFFNEKVNYEEDFKFKFGDILSYPFVKSEKGMVNKLQYGAVIGRDPTTGNLFVENLYNKTIEKIAKFERLIKIDDSIREYFEFYEEVERFDYCANRSVLRMNTAQINAESNSASVRLDIPASSPEKKADNTALIETAVSMRSATLQEEEFLKLRGSSLGDAPDTVNSSNRVGVEVGNLHCHDSDKDKTLHEILASIDHLIENETLRENLTTLMKDIDRICSKTESSIDESKSDDIDKEIEGKMDEAIRIIEPYIKDNTNTYHILALQMKYSKMFKLHGELTDDAGLNELGTISDRNTLIGVDKASIPLNAKIVYIMTRYVEKMKNGEFNKVKARTLLGGDVLRDVYEIRWDEVNSRTVSLSTLFMCLAIMAHEEMEVATMDFKNAFLYAELPEEDQCYAKLEKDEVYLLLKHDKRKWQRFVNKDDGCIYVKVKGALYGHPKAPQLWYEYIQNKLATLGFKPLKSEACIFTRVRDGKLSIICLHVDDLFIGTKDEKLFEELQQFKRELFNDEGTIEVGPVQEYLNMTIKFDRVDKSVEITQEPYWNKIMSRYDVNDTMNMPHTSVYMDRLRNRDEDMKGSSEEKLKFLSIVMSILWGAKRTFPSVLFNVTSLASQNKYGTIEDYEDALRVLKHINKHKEKGIRLKIKGKVQLSVFVDSSCNLHKDTRGHGGFVISLGNEGYGGPVETNSNKAKLNGRSSLEYELFEVHVMLPSILLLREVLEELGYKQDPIPVFEDNKALVEVFKRGKVSSGVLKHIAAKYYYAKDLMKQGIILFRYCPTELMIADIFTKNLSGPKYKALMKRLINYPDQEEGFSDEVYTKLYQGNVNELVKDDEKIDIEVINMMIRLCIQP